MTTFALLTFVLRWNRVISSAWFLWQTLDWNDPTLHPLGVSLSPNDQMHFTDVAHFCALLVQLVLLQPTTRSDWPFNRFHLTKFLRFFLFFYACLNECVRPGRMKLIKAACSGVESEVLSASVNRGSAQRLKSSISALRAGSQIFLHDS